MPLAPARDGAGIRRAQAYRKPSVSTTDEVRHENHRSYAVGETSGWERGESSHRVRQDHASLPDGRSHVRQPGSRRA
ncbi:hypothetical protein [Pseudomonas phage PAXYB1]|uniref:Uncharacterized protein n=2 Tax=Phikmvvirus TaxID=477967 RepID=A0A2P0P9X0_9CAUD|nr:hypothetical protein MPK7_34 [Pseudomonas phage MPK7]YP_009800424.1 hypothetical protein HOT06_gp40 [Pseudomonas phage PAXYB1]AFR52573.1 hypothetical protein MPK7_34 [Pseudomonas phage MPK7]ARB06217.1 hypothetical protein [Pseudomonas phage PAXYB1]